MTITPDQAQTLLDGATPGPWSSHHDEWEDENEIECEDFYVIGGTDGILSTENFDPDNHDPVANTALAAAAPDMAQTIAGCEEQWAAQWHANDARGWMLSGPLPVEGDSLIASEWTTESVARARLARLSRYESCTRLVRRLVGPVEVVDGE